MPQPRPSAYSRTVVGSALQGALARDGLTVQQWATHRGYLPHTVLTVLRRWGNESRPPHGGIARAIMADARAYVGMPQPGDTSSLGAAPTTH